MELVELEQANVAWVFERSEGRRRGGWWMLVGSAVLACVSLSGLLFAIFHRVDLLTLHLISTAPMVIAVSLLAGGWTLCRGPRRVTIDDDCLQIEWSARTSEHPWNDIGWATVTAVVANVQRQLVVYDRSGKKVALLSDAFGRFDELVAAVKSKVADQPESVSGAIRLRKARKTAIFMGSVAVVLIVISAGVAWFTYEEQRADKLLGTAGVEGEAAIDRLFVAPDGVTTRIEYTVSNDRGETGSRNVELEPAYHAYLTEAGARTIRVLFVPTEPTISRLHRGEISDVDFMYSTLGGYGVSGLGTLLGLLFLAGAALQWKGWDINLDSKTGKISIKRFGEGE